MSKKDFVRAQMGVMLGIMMSNVDVVTVDEDKPSLEDRLTDREVKECAYSKCSKKHNHNNACCSAKHYKLWRKERRVSV